MKVGVLFPSRFEEPGELLADARAMEAAGADSVWVDADAEGFDPLLTLATIAAITTNLRLGMLGSPMSRQQPGHDRRIATLQHLSRGRLIPDGVERWQRVEPPSGRAAWAKTLEDAEQEADGVLVPFDPRLLDILRNPDGEIDRSDLFVAQG